MAKRVLDLTNYWLDDGDPRPMEHDEEHIAIVDDTEPAPELTWEAADALDVIPDIEVA